MNLGLSLRQKVWLVIALLLGSLLGSGFAAYSGLGIKTANADSVATQASLRSGSVGGVRVMGGGPGEGK